VVSMSLVVMEHWSVVAPDVSSDSPTSGISALVQLGGRVEVGF
jgi:hypothetical protein